MCVSITFIYNVVHLHRCGGPQSAWTGSGAPEQRPPVIGLGSSALKITPGRGTCDMVHGP
jgi:hypothetical protein